MGTLSLRGYATVKKIKLPKGVKQWSKPSPSSLRSLLSAALPIVPTLYPIDWPPGQYSSTATWSACKRAVSYELQSSGDGESWQKIYSGPDKSYKFESNFQNGVVFCRVRAINPVGETSWSNVASASFRQLPPHIDKFKWSTPKYGQGSMSNINLGESVLLEWSVSNCSSNPVVTLQAVSYDNPSGGPLWTRTYIGYSGSYTDTPLVWVNYTLTVTANNGTTSCPIVGPRVIGTPNGVGLSGAFIFTVEPGTEVSSVTVTFKGTWFSGDSMLFGVTSFSVQTTIQIPVAGTQQTATFTVSGLRPGVWSITATPNAIAASMTCPSVNVPGTVTLDRITGQCQCG
jgi:hypothetical protein